MRRAESAGPTPSEAETARERLGDLVRVTPLWRWRGERIDALIGKRTEALMKLELFQHSGSFKPRGALLNMLALDGPQLARGVTAVSAGNHAMAVGYAAGVLNTSARVVMPRSADPARVDGCRRLGVDVLLVDDVHQAFAEVRRIEREEGRFFVHPFEGQLTVLGTATLGLELCGQAPGLDAVIVPIGGGGLCAGVAAIVKALQPRCRVIGVEPEGADSMHRSFEAGRPASIKSVDTIADSLGAPHAEPYTYSLCRMHVDELVLVSDDMLRRAMLLMFEEAKLVVEPAGAAAVAALFGPLRERAAGRRIAMIVCGSNISAESFYRQVSSIP
jgi:threonine dehydratase